MYKQKITLGVRVEEDLKRRGTEINKDFKTRYINLQTEIGACKLPLREKTSRDFIKKALRLFEDAIIENMISLESVNREAFIDLFSREQMYLDTYQEFFDEGKFEANVLGEFITSEIHSVSVESLNLNTLEDMHLISVYCSKLIKDLAYITASGSHKFSTFINVILKYMLNSLNSLTDFANKEANANIRVVLEYLIGIAQEVYDLNGNCEEIVVHEENKFIPSNLYCYKELNRFAKDNGFEKIRDNGDHGVFRRFDGSTVVIPQGRDIGRGLSRTLQKRIVSKEVTTW